MERLKVWMLEENSSSFVRNYYSAPRGKANVYTAKLNTFTLSQCLRNIIPITYLNAQKHSVCTPLLSLWFKMLFSCGLKCYFLIWCHFFWKMLVKLSLRFHTYCNIVTYCYYFVGCKIASRCSWTPEQYRIFYLTWWYSWKHLHDL